MRIGERRSERHESTQLNTKALDRALQAQADRLCRLTPRPEVLQALAHRIEERAQYGAEHVG
jgi:hypothetical protein